MITAADDPRIGIIVRVITDWGGGPDDSLHSWRCAYPGRAACNCLQNIAQEICDALGTP